MPKRLSFQSFVWQPVDVGQPPSKKRKETPKNCKHSKAEWLRHREKIEELFQAHELARVAEVMIEQEGFHATEAQYHHKLKEWGSTWKNLRLSRLQKLELKEKAVQRALDFKPRLGMRVNGKKAPSDRVSRVLKNIFRDSTYGSVEPIIESHLANIDLNKATDEFDSAALDFEFSEHDDTSTLFDIRSNDSRSPPLSDGATIAVTSESSPGTSLEGTPGDMVLSPPAMQQSHSESGLLNFSWPLRPDPDQKGLDDVPEAHEPRRFMSGRADTGTGEGSSSRPPEDATGSANSTYKSSRYTTTKSLGISVYTSSSRGASIPSFIGMPSLTRQLAAMLRKLPTDAEIERDLKSQLNEEEDTPQIPSYPRIASRMPRVSAYRSTNLETINMHEQEVVRIDSYNRPFMDLCTSLNLHLYDDTFWRHWNDILPDVVSRARKDRSSVSSVRSDEGIKRTQFRVDLVRTRRDALVEIERLYHQEWDYNYLFVCRPRVDRTQDDERSLQLVLFEKEVIEAQEDGDTIGPDTIRPRRTITTAILARRDMNNRNAAAEYSYRLRTLVSFDAHENPSSSATAMTVRCADVTCDMPLFTLDSVPLDVDAISCPKIKRITFYSVNAFDPAKKSLWITPLRGQISPMEDMKADITPPLWSFCHCGFQDQPAWSSPLAFSFCSESEATEFASTIAGTMRSEMTALSFGSGSPRDALASLIFGRDGACSPGNWNTWNHHSGLQRPQVSADVINHRASLPTVNIANP